MVDVGSLVSVIIVNWNGLKWLKPCLNSIYNQTYRNFEIIFVDNASTDKSVKFVKDNYPKVIIIQNKENLGFAEANNIGFKNTRGNFIFLLNNDTIVEKNCLELLLESFQKIPNLGAVQPKILLMNNHDRLGGCGMFLTKFFKFYHYGFKKKQDLEKYNKTMPIFSVSGSAMFLKKELIEKINLFDDDFWCYYEDVDLCYKVWLAGYECWYYPTAEIYHAINGTSSLFNKNYIGYHVWKNSLLIILKDFEFKTIVKILPINLLLAFLFIFLLLISGNLQAIRSFLKAIWWNIKNIKITLKKRRWIQSLRQKTDKQILEVVGKEPKLTYYYYLFTGQLEKYND